MTRSVAQLTDQQLPRRSKGERRPGRDHVPDQGRLGPGDVRGQARHAPRHQQRPARATRSTQPAGTCEGRTPCRDQRQQRHAPDRRPPDPAICPAGHRGSPRTSSPVMAGMYVPGDSVLGHPEWWYITLFRAPLGARLAEINHAAAATGDDPELDTLLLRLHTETACRRGGAHRGASPRSCPACRSWSWPWAPPSPTCCAPTPDPAAGRGDRPQTGPPPGPARTRPGHPRTSPRALGHPRKPVLPPGQQRSRGRTTAPARGPMHRVRPRPARHA